MTLSHAARGALHTELDILQTEFRQPAEPAVKNSGAGVS
jgi:hypothetical protein